MRWKGTYRNEKSSLVVVLKIPPVLRPHGMTSTKFINQNSNISKLRRRVVERKGES